MARKFSRFQKIGFVLLAIFVAIPLCFSLNVALFGMPLEMLTRALNETICYSQSVSQETFFKVLREPSAKGKLFFQENDWLSLLNLQTEKVIRIRTLLKNTHSHRVSGDGNMMSFIVGRHIGKTQIIYLYDIQKNSVTPITWTGVYERQVVSYSDSHGKMVSDTYPSACPLHGGSNNFWYGLCRDLTGPQLPSSIFRYDGEKVEGTILVTLPTESYYFTPDNVCIDTNENYLYIAAAKLLKKERDKQDSSEAVLFRMDLKNGTLREFTLTENAFNSYAAVPGSDNLWIYTRSAFHLWNPFDQTRLCTIKMGDFPIRNKSYTQDYFDRFVADVSGNLYGIRKEGTEVFGIIPFYRVYRVDNTGQIEVIKKIYGLSGLQWLP